MYMVEIFIDKVSIFLSEGEVSAASKNLIIKIKFGPKTQFIIKEGQLAKNETDKKADDVIECDELNRRKFTRIIRVGKSILFPSYPDTVLQILEKFPLEIEVWNDDENEEEIFVGIGTMLWDTAFYFMLKETAEACKHVEPLSIKQMTPITAECCCKQVGEISFILRLSALGDSIITEFQQLMKDPETFVFRTNRAPSMFSSKRIEGSDPNFCMVGSLYETTTLEDPDVVNAAQQKIEICTELQSCGVSGGNKEQYSCQHKESTSSMEPKKKKYPIDKIRMGDITGPCGNTNCPLAHKVKMYIRNLDTYKKEAANVTAESTGNVTRKVCGACTCKDDRWHRDACKKHNQEGTAENKALCSGCGGMTKVGSTCEDRSNKLATASKEPTPKTSKVTIAYVYSITNIPTDSLFIKKTLSDKINHRHMDHKLGYCRSENSEIYYRPNQNSKNCEEDKREKCTERTIQYADYEALMHSLTLPQFDHKTNVTNVYNCTTIGNNKDCCCARPKPPPACSTFDCDCIAESINITARKQHKPFCPAYKHKSECPVTKMNEEHEEEKKKDEDEEEVEALPYGLPPIQLGPCPVMGKPCSVPDGFARMYKTAALQQLPPSYGEAGKVCCSKEYERIKKALKEYMKYEKDNDFRCLNRFNVDTERRCCDKEQVLMAMTGKGCCGAHKLAIQEKYKEDKK